MRCTDTEYCGWERIICAPNKAASFLEHEQEVGHTCGSVTPHFMPLPLLPYF